MATLKDIQIEIGTLSKPSKMPCAAWSIPAANCKTGSKLAQVPGSVCYDCYALKGNYQFSNVQKGLQHRQDALDDLPRWTRLMSELIRRKTKADNKYFRWFDSGDLQSYGHLLAIVDIAHALPDISFWLPTKEPSLVARYTREKGQFPANLTVRVSAPMLNQSISGGRYENTSRVTTDTTDWARKCASDGNDLRHCRAPLQGNKCLDCRLCWDPTVVEISYPQH